MRRMSSVDERKRQRTQPQRREPFHVLTVGWDVGTIKHLADPVQAATGFLFSHIPEPSLDSRSLARWRGANLFFLRDGAQMKLPPPDRTMLTALEQPGVPTIHNMILGDRVVSRLHYADALAYACHLAQKLEEIFSRVRPSIVLGGFDSIHNGIAMAVARKMNIPWCAISFTALPSGMSGFCTGLNPGTCVSYLPASAEILRARAEQTVGDFEARRLVVPLYLSANSAVMIARRLPRHIRSFYRALTRAFAGRFDKFTQYPVRRLAWDYIRRRMNLLLLPTKSFVKVPPPTPFLFFGLHMQPESSIDVWAPFFADQFAVVEAMARSVPPTHHLLVKLHKSDADNYSRGQLKRLSSLPGVRIVSPYADSRSFIEQASLVFAIQGSMTMEAALLGRPVLFFGESRFTDLAGVSKVKRMTDLPDQIRSKLSERQPAKEDIIRGLMSYFSWYAPGCYNDWEVSPSKAEIDALAEHFRAMRDHLESLAQVPGVATEPRVVAADEATRFSV